MKAGLKKKTLKEPDFLFKVQRLFNLPAKNGGRLITNHSVITIRFYPSRDDKKASTSLIDNSL